MKSDLLKNTDVTFNDNIDVCYAVKASIPYIANVLRREILVKK